MSDRVQVHEVTEGELRGWLEAIYDRFPSLRDFRPDCCSGCAEQDVAAIHGWGDAVGAWREVENVRFLLGEDL